MDLSAIFQLRNKKFWWMDVIFYFAVSALLATVICYVIFWVKNNMLSSDITKENTLLQQVGTSQQKEQEAEVLNYKNKIIDFTNLVKNHEFASNIFAFMQTQTMPNVWFKQFSLDEQGASVQLPGEADSMDTFSRQVAVFENNKYVKSIGSVNSTVGTGGRVEFSFNLTLDPSIFNYITENAQAVQAAASAASAPVTVAQTGAQNNPATVSTPVTAVAPAPAPSQALITSFSLPLSPAVIGLINQTNYIITLNAPAGTNLKGLVPLMSISAGAVVSPASNIPQDFTNPVTYTVALPGGASQSYKVVTNVIQKSVAAAPPSSSSSNNSGLIEMMYIAAAALVVILAGLAFILFVIKRSKTKI